MHVHNRITFVIKVYFLNIFTYFQNINLHRLSEDMPIFALVKQFKKGFTKYVYLFIYRNFKFQKWKTITRSQIERMEWMARDSIFISAKKIWTMVPLRETALL